MLGSVGYFSRGIRRRLSSAPLRHPIRILHQLIFPTTSSHFLKGKLKNRDVSAAIMVACTKNVVVIAAMLWSYKWNRPLIIARAEPVILPCPIQIATAAELIRAQALLLKAPGRWNLSLPAAPTAELRLMAICGIIWEASVNDTHLKYNLGEVERAEATGRSVWEGPTLRARPVLTIAEACIFAPPVKGDIKASFSSFLDVGEKSYLSSSWQCLPSYYNKGLQTFPVNHQT